MLTYVLVRSRVAMRAELCKSRSLERLSLRPCAPAPFPHKVSSLRCGTLRGPRILPHKVSSLRCGTLRGPRILPHKVSSLRCGTLWGPRKQGPRYAVVLCGGPVSRGSFLAFHPNDGVFFTIRAFEGGYLPTRRTLIWSSFASHEHLFEACLTPTYTHSGWSLNFTSLFRRRV